MSHAAFNAYNHLKLDPFFCNYLVGKKNYNFMNSLNCCTFLIQVILDWISISTSSTIILVIKLREWYKNKKCKMLNTCKELWRANESFKFEENKTCFFVFNRFYQRHFVVLFPFLIRQNLEQKIFFQVFIVCMRDFEEKRNLISRLLRINATTMMMIG